MGPRMITHTHTHIFIVLAIISQLHRTSVYNTGLSGRNSFVQFGRLHKVVSVNAPITNYPRHHNDYMQLFLFSGINFLMITITITLFNP